MSTSKRVAKNFLSLSFAEVATRLLGTLLTIYVARILGPGAFGQLAFATAFIAFFNIFADFGLTTFGLREIAKDRAQTNRLGGQIVIFQLALSFLLVCVLAVILAVLPLSEYAKLITFLFGLGIVPAALNMSYIFQAHERMEYVALTRILAQVMYLGIGLGAIYYWRSITALPVAQLISSIAGAVAVFLILRRKFAFGWTRADWPAFKKLLIVAVPFVIAGLLGEIYHNADFVILQFLKGDVVVGYYSAGYKIINILLSLGMILLGVYFPLIARGFAESGAAFRMHSLELAKSAGFFAIPTVVGGWLVSHDVIQTFYGQGYDSSVVAFNVLLFLPVLILLNVVLANPLIIANYQKQNTISVAIGAGVNVLLNFLLIPHIGMLGAAWATVAAETAVCLYLLIIFAVKLDFIGMILRGFFIKPAIGAIVMGLLIALVPGLNLYVRVALGGIVYLAAMYSMRGIPLVGSRQLGEQHAA